MQSSIKLQWNILFCRQSINFERGEKSDDYLFDSKIKTTIQYVSLFSAFHDKYSNFYGIERLNYHLFCKTRLSLSLPSSYTIQSHIVCSHFGFQQNCDTKFSLQKLPNHVRPIIVFNVIRFICKLVWRIFFFSAITVDRTSNQSLIKFRSFYWYEEMCSDSTTTL